MFSILTPQLIMVTPCIPEHVMKILAHVSLLLCSLTLFAGDKPDAAILDRWVGGRWVIKDAKVAAVSNCAWSPDHVFVVCDQEVNADGKHTRYLSVYGFDPATSKYFFHGISLGDEKPHSTALEISADGNHWVYSATEDASKDATQYRTINQFHGPDLVEWQTESSNDGGKTWTKTAGGKEIRER